MYKDYRGIYNQLVENTYRLPSPATVPANTISSLWIWKGVSATLQSGRYTLSYPRGRYVYLMWVWCWASVSATLDQHWNCIGWMYRDLLGYCSGFCMYSHCCCKISFKILHIPHSHCPPVNLHKTTICKKSIYFAYGQIRCTLRSVMRCAEICIS